MFLATGLYGTGYQGWSINEKICPKKLANELEAWVPPKVMTEDTMFPCCATRGQVANAVRSNDTVDPKSSVGMYQVTGRQWVSVCPNRVCNTTDKAEFQCKRVMLDGQVFQLVNPNI